MKLKYVLFVILLGLSTSLFSAPTVNGSTGLIIVPTAEALKYKEGNIALDFLSGQDEDGKSLTEWVYKMNLGTFENWELGVVGGTTPTEGMYLNVKYYLIADDSRLPLSIAIGSQNLSSSESTDVYMVASKKFRPDLGVHMGFRAVFSPGDLDPNFMSGINFLAKEELEFLADIDGRQDVYTINIGSRYYFQNNVSMHVYILDIGQRIENNTKVAIGITMSKFLL